MNTREKKTISDAPKLKSGDCEGTPQSSWLLHLAGDHHQNFETKPLLHGQHMMRCMLTSNIAVDPPLDPVEADLPAFLEAARGLGLNEGATLIHESRGGSPRTAGGGRIARLVFTNVEPKMRIWGLDRPAPLLLLSRRNDGIQA